MSQWIQRTPSLPCITYHSRQQGLPDALHKRYFQSTDDGMMLRLVVEYEPRKGVIGLFDKFIMKRGVEGALRTTIDNLENRFLQNKW